VLVVVVCIVYRNVRHGGVDRSSGGMSEGFGEYRVKGKIAHGGQGTVLLIQRRHDGREFALKVIICQENKDRMTALHEFEIMQSCQGHSNMIELVDMFMNWEEDDRRAPSPKQPLLRSQVAPTSSGALELSALNQDEAFVQPFHHGNATDAAAIASLTHAPRFVAIVTEYYPAGSLTRYILHATQPIDEVIVWSSIFQIANLLHFLHTRKPVVVHQDIKPDNILVDMSTNRLVVTDFGLAVRLTKNFRGNCMGTHFFMSPETTQGLTTEKSDLWALGCVLYVLCTRRATTERHARYLFREVRDEGFHDDILHELEELGYTSQLAELCTALLQAKGEDRPSARDVVERCQESCPHIGSADFLKGSNLSSPQALKSN
jgi:serine/threonine protein kinase